jgi:hypothetical protein
VDESELYDWDREEMGTVRFFRFFSEWRGSSTFDGDLGY